MTDLLSLDLHDLTLIMEKHQLPKFRAKQIFQWVHQKGVTSVEGMNNLPKDMHQVLAESVYITNPEIINKSVALTGDTTKFLLKFSDGAAIETVLMSYDKDDSRDRNTVCVSTQVGCNMGCRFCATGISGMERNLTTGEILAQVWAAERQCRESNFATGITNVVYMGMGEPLVNLDNVVKSIKILNDPLGLNIGMRRITVSTCGLVPQIYKLAELNLPIVLAISLHAPNDELRSNIMPINDKYPIEEIIKACREYGEKTGRRVTYEYALFKGVNDSEREAKQLGKLLKGLLANVNIIPANPVEECGFKRPEQHTVRQFAKILAEFGISASVREEKGVDIDAACGQLRRRTLQSQGQA